MSDLDLDGAHVADLAMRVMVAINDHLAAGPPSRRKIYEALNAMAVATATILVSTQDKCEETRMWFDGALDQSIVDFDTKERS